VTFTEETVECDGTSADVITNRSCIVNLTTLRADPYNLVLYDDIYIKIISINSYGESFQSNAGNNAYLQLVPDAPILTNDEVVTNANEIGITWVEGASNGGDPVIDYKLWFKHLDDADFYILEEVLTDTSYTTSIILQPNNLYQLKIKSRNLVGYSEDSNTVTIRSAKVPDVPTDLLTSIDGLNVVVSWTSAYTGGSPLIEYVILV
jgi:hypothetical protein